MSVISVTLPWCDERIFYFPFHIIFLTYDPNSPNLNHITPLCDRTAVFFMPRDLVWSLKLHIFCQASSLWENGTGSFLEYPVLQDYTMSMVRHWLVQEWWLMGDLMGSSSAHWLDVSVVHILHLSLSNIPYLMREYKGG